MLYYLVATVYVLACFLLLLVVLLQQWKGGDMASAFGGSGSQAAFGARAGATILTKATTIAAVLFMLGALALAIVGRRGPGSVVSGTAAPAPAETPAAQTTPASPAPETTPASPAAQTTPPAPATPAAPPPADAPAPATPAP